MNRANGRTGAPAAAHDAADVLVRGAGACGMAAALALSRQGLAVALLGELDEPARPDIRAYALNAASVALLRSLKVWDALPDDARCPVHEMQVRGDAPGASLGFSAWELAAAELAWIVDAAELERALRAAVRFAAHVQPVREAVPAALTVLAEGKESATRAALGVAMPRHAYGHTAVAARLACDRPHAGIAHQWFRSPDVLALLPLERPQRERSFGLVWSMPQAQAGILLAAEPAAFEARLAEATGGAAGGLRLAGERAAWPLALARAEATHGDGWVLVGDAAHVVHPLAGQGLNLGLADVAELATVLAGREPWRALGDAKLLARYSRARRAPVAAMAGLTDALLHLFATDQPLLRALRNQGLNWVDRLPPLKRALSARAIGG